MENQDLSINLTPQSKEYLLKTAKWVEFIAVVGYMAIALLILLGFIISVFLNSLFSEIMPESLSEYGFVGFIYIVFGIVFLIPTVYLHKFSVKMKKAMLLNKQLDFETALSSQKSFFKFIGIYTIVVLVFYTAVLLASLLLGSLF